jgi:hypothetical protein
MYGILDEGWLKIEADFFLNNPLQVVENHF